MGSIISAIDEKIREHGSWENYEKYLVKTAFIPPRASIEPLKTTTMKSEFCQWVTEVSKVAEVNNDVVEAKYYDGLDYFFKLRLQPDEAYRRYKDLVRRCFAIEADPK